MAVPRACSSAGELVRCRAASIALPQSNCHLKLSPVTYFFPFSWIVWWCLGLSAQFKTTTNDWARSILALLLKDVNRIRVNYSNIIKTMAKGQIKDLLDLLVFFWPSSVILSITFILFPILSSSSAAHTLPLCLISICSFVSYPSNVSSPSCAPQISQKNFLNKEEKEGLASLKFLLFNSWWLSSLETAIFYSLRIQEGTTPILSSMNLQAWQNY